MTTHSPPDIRNFFQLDWDTLEHQPTQLEYMRYSSARTLEGSTQFKDNDEVKD